MAAHLKVEPGTCIFRQGKLSEEFRVRISDRWGLLPLSRLFSLLKGMEYNILACAKKIDALKPFFLL